LLPGLPVRDLQAALQTPLLVAALGERELVVTTVPALEMEASEVEEVLLSRLAS